MIITIKKRVRRSVRPPFSLCVRKSCQTECRSLVRTLSVSMLDWFPLHRQVQQSRKRLLRWPRIFASYLPHSSYSWYSQLAYQLYNYAYHKTTHIDLGQDIWPYIPSPSHNIMVKYTTVRLTDITLLTLKKLAARKLLESGKELTIEDVILMLLEQYQKKS